jgi:putative glutamine amidotransferase
MRPVIGITMDLVEVAVSGGGTRLRAECGLAYARCVEKAGGVPIFLPPIVALVETHLGLVRGVILTGGNDPRTEPFGEATHPAATLVHDERQAYETALLKALEARRAMPVLGICLGMQMMALAAGGRLDQHLPERLGAGAARHRAEGGVWHPVVLDAPSGHMLGLGGPAGQDVVSHHHQAVADAGRLTVLARDEDGTIEAVADPSRAYAVGVQWHPERTGIGALGQGVFDAFVGRCREG